MADIFGTYRSISFMGKPGSGKGTQAKFLSEKTGFQVFSVGNELRDLHKTGTPLALRLKSVMDSGGLVPSWMVEYFFHEKTLFLKEDEGIIYEGTNRKPHEGEVFHEVMTWLDRPYRVVFLSISDEESLKRTVSRRSMSLRADDNETSAKERLEWYYSDTQKVVSFFREKGTLVEVNGEQDEKAVFEEILEKLEGGR